MTDRIEGLVLKNFDQGENDALAVILTAESGKVYVKMRGAKNAAAKLTPFLQPLNQVIVAVVPPVWSALPIAIGVESLLSGSILPENLPVALAALGLADSLTSEFAPAPHLVKALTGLLKNARLRSLGALALEKVALVALKEAGHAPELDECLTCGQKPTTNTYFSIGQGGLVCQICGRYDASAFKVSGAAIALLGRLGDNKKPLANKPTLSTIQEARSIINEFTQFVAPKQLYAFDFLNLFS